MADRVGGCSLGQGQSSLQLRRPVWSLLAPSGLSMYCVRSCWAELRCPLLIPCFLSPKHWSFCPSHHQIGGKVTRLGKKARMADKDVSPKGGSRKGCGLT